MQFFPFSGIKSKEEFDSVGYNGLWRRLASMWNDHDSGAMAWTTVSTGSLTATGAITAPAFVGLTSFSQSLATGFGTVSNGSAFYRRVGDTMIVRGTFKSGTIAGTLASIGVPVSAAIDYTKISTNGDAVGVWWNSHTELIESNNDSGVVFVDGSDTANFYFGQSGTTGGLFAKANCNAIVHSSNDYFYWKAEIPISGWTF